MEAAAITGAGAGPPTLNQWVLREPGTIFEASRPWQFLHQAAGRSLPAQPSLPSPRVALKAQCAAPSDRRLLSGAETQATHPSPCCHTSGCVSSGPNGLRTPGHSERTAGLSPHTASKAGSGCGWSCSAGRGTFPEASVEGLPLTSPPPPPQTG